jgi:glycosyltransferase involved in cell wall biosynthesis
VRVHIVDPSAYTPPYDHALCCALAGAGAAVDLYTSRFSYAKTPTPQGYERHEVFYRAAHRLPVAGSRGRLALACKLAEHVPDMLRYRRVAAGADVVHFQWLTVQPLDLHLLPARRAGRALVVTAHDILPREARPAQRTAQRRLYDRFDAVVVHSEHGRGRLIDELGLAPERVHVIAHGVLRPWAQEAGVAASGAPGGPAAGPPASERMLTTFGEPAAPVALFFGLLRPYKGLDVLLDAWNRVQVPSSKAPPQLWIAGMPRMDISGLRGAAAANVRILADFVSDSELRWLLSKASVIVLPYREIDASGVAFTAIGAGVPLVLSDAGGFPEIAATGAARLVPRGDSVALAGVLGELLDSPAGLEQLRGAAAQAAAGPYAWTEIGRRTLALYESLLQQNPKP